MEQLQDRTAVVTGAARGIGYSLVRRLVAEGMNVVMADVDEAALERAVSGLEPAGVRVLAMAADVSRRSDVEDLAARTLAEFGSVHLVCNNAGVGISGRAWEFAASDWDRVLGVNLYGVIHGIAAFVPHLLRQGEGHVVNTASMAGLASFPGMAPYTATKHAVVGLSESLLLELRAVGSPVGVSVLCPGPVRTAIADAEGVDAGTRRAVAAGLDPAVVAEAIVDAVRADRFWVLTHPELLAAVESRTTAILDAGHLARRA